MSIPITDQTGEVKVYGSGAPGGKGAGLIRMSDISLPKVGKLRTRILSTDFFDKYQENGSRLGDEALSAVATILGELGDIPLGIRSSATNEAGRTGTGIGPVHAGETPPLCCRITIPTPLSVWPKLSGRSAIFMMTSAGNSRPTAGRRWRS